MVDFALFFVLYAQEKGWDIPRFHIEICDWLDSLDSASVLMLPRGHGKSTIIEVFNAYKIFKNPQELILAMSSTDSDALKTSRAVIDILANHPLTKDTCTQSRGTVTKWWVNDCEDVKHGNMFSKGILANITGARANLIINDDVEVPNTTASQELRDKLAYRLSEQIHILIPNGNRLFVGTPHSHDSLYDRVLASGANSCIKPMYQYSKRIENVKARQLYKLESYDVYYVFNGIGTQANIPKYIILNGYIMFKEDYNLVDIYAEALWPERFTNDIMLQRRKECSNLNEWDSQYMLISKPVGGNALDIDKFIPYTSEIKYVQANSNTTCYVNDTIAESVIAFWDPSSGKVGRDISSVSVVYKDIAGKMYWQDCVSVTGDIALTRDNGRIYGGQVWDVCDVIEKYRLPAIHIEVNGIGGHIPSILKACLKTRGIACSVIEIHSTGNKNTRILNIQSYLLSNSLYIHTSILNNQRIIKQINNFNPNTTKNKDDDLDSLANCLINTASTLGYIDIHKQTRFSNYGMYSNPVVASGF